MNEQISEAAVARQLAEETWESIHGPNGNDGELAAAYTVFQDGLGRLDFLKRYRSWEQKQIDMLDTALKGLRAAAFQREQTAVEFEIAADVASKSERYSSC
jgi:hypothetical protein